MGRLGHGLNGDHVYCRWEVSGWGAPLECMEQPRPGASRENKRRSWAASCGSTRTAHWGLQVAGTLYTYNGYSLSACFSAGCGCPAASGRSSWPRAWRRR